MAHAIIWLTDTHCGSRVGLWTRGAQLKDGGDGIRQYLLDCFDHARTEWLPGVIGNVPRIVILGGDLVDGVSPKAEICTDDEAEQMREGMKILKPWCDDVEQVRGVAGTDFHAGKGGKWDNMVCEWLGARADNAGRYAQRQYWGCVDGVTIDTAHHIGGSYVTASQATPLTREYTDHAMSVFEHNWPRAQWIVRAHSHRYRLVPYDDGDVTVVSLPGWQGKTGYAHKMSRGAPFSVGVFVLITDEGVAHPFVKLYEWARPTVEVIGWQNPNPASHTQTGPTCSDATPAAATSAPSGSQSPTLLRRLGRRLRTYAPGSPTPSGKGG